MFGSSKNLKLWLILAAVPIVLSILIISYAKYNYEEQEKTATRIANDWEPNEREIERIYRREVLDTEENSILLNINNKDAESQEFLTPEYLEAEAAIAKAKTEISNKETYVQTERTMVEDEKLQMDEDGNPVIYEVNDGEWLASIALKLYGNKAFWGYLYEVNRDMLHSPDDVKAGMELYLPNKEYYNIDTTNIYIQKAAKMSAMFLNE